MSKSRKPISELGLDNLVDRFQGALSCENKPDFKEVDLGSPVSPLRTNRNGGPGGGGVGLATASSSSSSSGSVSGKTANNPLVKSHSGELCGSSESSPSAAESGGGSGTKGCRPGHRRSNSTGAPPLIYSGGNGGVGGVCSGGGGGSSVNSPVNALPAGNICPSGKILKTGMAHRSAARSDVLGSGTVNYGHGSIMRGGGKAASGGSEGNVMGNIQFAGETVMVKRAMNSGDPEEVKKAGNEQYKKGHFAEALSLYNWAIAIAPDNAAYRSNRAAALTGLGRLVEAVKECEEAVKLDPCYGRAHQRLASLHLRLGQVETARRHLCFLGQQPDPAELLKLQIVEKHLSRCTDARKVGDWKSTLREGDAAIAAGADSSPHILACRVEALLKLHQLKEAEASQANIPKFEQSSASFPQYKFCGILTESYVFYVRAQVEMALGRFENAVTAAMKAGQIDPQNVEVAVMLNNVKLAARARAHGNDLFKSGKFAEASSAYEEGLKINPSNSVLYCNRAACWAKLGHWEKSIEDCNEALKIQPNYTKALLRRATSHEKLKQWSQAVRDYEVLRRELPGDNEVAEALFHAQVALKKLRGEEISNMKFGGEVEVILGLDQFRAAISSPGVSVVLFKNGMNQQCEQIYPFMDTLCTRYPLVNFLKVDVEESKTVANSENVRIVPTFKIYKNGSRVKEMICPSQQVLEYSVRHYSL